MAATTADRAQRYVESARSALEAMAKRPLVSAMDPDHCDPELAALRELYGRPTNIVVVNLEGRIICGSTPPPRDRVVRIVDDKLLREMIAEPRFRLSRPLVGQITKRWAVTAVQPVLAPAGGLAGTVAMSIDLRNWVSFTPGQAEPRSAVHAVVTAEGIVIARSAESEAWIGRNVGASEIHRRMTEMKRGTVRSPGSASADRVWGFTPVAGTGWYALSSVSANRIYGPVRARIAESLVLLVAALAIAGAAAYAWMRRLREPMRGIEEAVRARAEGSTKRRVPVAGPREVAGLANELNRMIDAGERMERAVREAELRFRSIFENTIEGIFQSTSEGRVIACNPAHARIMGYESPEEFIAAIGDAGAQVYVDPDDRRRLFEQLGKHGLVHGFEARFRRKDGSVIWVSMSVRALRDATGAITHILGMQQDVTEQKRAESALQRFRLAMDSSPDSIYLTDAAGMKFVDVNAAACRRLGYTREQLLHMGPEDVLGRDRDTIRREYDEVVAAGEQGLRIESRFVRSDGSERWTEIHRRALHVDGQSLIVTIGRDITERKRADDRIRRLNRVYVLLSGINGAIVRIRDRAELFQEACRIAVGAGQFPLAWIGIVNSAEERIDAVAWAGDERGFVKLVRPTIDAPGGGKAGLSATAASTRKPAVCNDIAADGSAMRYAGEALERGYRSAVALPLEAGGAAIGALVLYAGEVGFFDDEEIKLLVELAGDISFALEHIENEEKLNYLALYDSLTGLANRSLFLERLSQYVHIAGQTGEKLALVTLDVERLRTINDSLGRQAGDALIKELAERLAGGAGRGELARISADNFAIVMQVVKGRSEVTRRIEKVWGHCFGEHFRLGDTEVRVSARAGVALFPNDGAIAETLLRNAEAALRSAKKTGERHVFHAPEMTAKTAEKLSLETKLRQALEKGEFVLHYQPKVDLVTRRIAGVEALIRWQSPELGLVPPMQFIPLMEETGLILEVGNWALSRAAADHARWLQQSLPAPRVAVNVSPIQLRKRDYVATVEEALKRGATPPGIDLEITESLVMEDIQGNIEKLKAVRALGVSIAIDDFGTGYSSLGYLAKLPVQSLKIDRSFIITMLNDPDTMTLVQTIISLAHSLKLKVVAEGVDAEEQAKYLRLLRCDEMQGYLFSKPLPLEQMTALLAKT